MKNKLSLVLFFVFANCVLGQERVSGTIMGGDSKLPLTYAHIINKNNGKATITNEDGKFSLKSSPQDTLILSYLSYERKEVPSNYFLTNDIYYLIPLVNELDGVEVFSDKKIDVLDLLFAARKKMMGKEVWDSKVHFSLKSTNNASPAELIEGYYNGKVKRSGFDDLKLKNGRIGVAGGENKDYFVSLSTTDIISRYDLLRKSIIFPFPKDPRKPGFVARERIPALPINPLQLTRSQIQKRYSYRIVGKKGNVYEIEFKLAKDSEKNDYFNAFVGIDAESEQIVFLELSGTNIKFPPFYEINEVSIDSLNFNLAYYFDDASNLLNEVVFDYSFDYRVLQKKIKTKGAFLFYDKESLFDLPSYSTPQNFLTDYKKMVHRPFDELFWKNIQEVILPSQESQHYQAFFDKNGVLLNFDDFDFSNHPLLKEHDLKWSKKRKISYYTIRRLSNFRDIYDARVTTNDFKFAYRLFLDRNTFNDSTYYKSQTFIDYENSYYSAKPDQYTNAFINMYFDMVELGRRNMDAVLSERYWTKAQTDSIFASTIRKLDVDLKAYENEARMGYDQKEFKKYIDLIKRTLQVDNAELIYDTGALDIMDERVAGVKKGIEFLKSKRYRAALGVFEKYEHLGEEYPWIYHNMGLAHFYLNEKSIACSYFDKSKKYGEHIDPELTRQCDKLKP